MIAPASSLLKPLLTPASISACCCPRSREPRSRQAALRRRARARRGVFNPPARARVEQILGLRLPAEADRIARRDPGAPRHRADERRVGKEFVSTCISLGSPYLLKKNIRN